MIRSKQDWLFHINAQISSGLSMAEYCRQNDVRVSSFYAARSRYGFTTKTQIDETKVRNSSNSRASVATERTGSEWNQQTEPLFEKVVVAPTTDELDSRHLSFIPANNQPLYLRGTAALSLPPGPIPDKEIELVCNGIHLVLPPDISDLNLCKVIRSCVWI